MPDRPTQPTEHRPRQPPRRWFNAALVAAWAAIASSGALLGAMFVDFLAPKALRTRVRRWRAGRESDFAAGGTVYGQFRRTPDGEPGFFLSNLSGEGKLVAMSARCTHLGCVINWRQREGIFRCPCHGSAFSADGANIDGPAPRPLERFAIHRDRDGTVVVDTARAFRGEAGQWHIPDSYLRVNAARGDGGAGKWG